MTAALRAFALFTVLPVRNATPLTRGDAVSAVRWLPVVGAAVGATAGLPMTAVLHGARHATVLGAVLAVLVLVLVTRALHLDGLADTVDALGSHAPAERALEIMRRSDIGPFGVIAIVLVLLVDVTALTSLDGGMWRPVAALAVAAATGRAAVLLAALARVPAARPDGFGNYVAGSQSTPILASEVCAVLGFGVASAASVHGSLLGWPLAQLGALTVTTAVCWHATRRFGGVTGDVFGALIEIGTAATLAGLTLS
jgi:adenosylcobinamide-GDP ribazoletransferase